MRRRRFIRLFAVGAVAGAAAGAVTGAGARVAMRMIADGVVDAVGRRPEFTVAGTAVVVLTGVLAGASAGLGYAAVRERLRGPAGVRGLTFGVLCLAIAGPFFLRTEEFFSAGRVLLFAALFPLYGVTLGLATAKIAPAVARFPFAAQAGLALAGGASAALGTIGFAVSALGIDLAM